MLPSLALRILCLNTFFNKAFVLLTNGQQRQLFNMMRDAALITPYKENETPSLNQAQKVKL